MSNVHKETLLQSVIQMLHIYRIFTVSWDIHVHLNPRVLNIMLGWSLNSLLSNIPVN